MMYERSPPSDSSINSPKVFSIQTLTWDPASTIIISPGNKLCSSTWMFTCFLAFIIVYSSEITVTSVLSIVVKIVSVDTSSFMYVELHVLVSV